MKARYFIPSFRDQLSWTSKIIVLKENNNCIGYRRDNGKKFEIGFCDADYECRKGHLIEIDNVEAALLL